MKKNYYHVGQVGHVFENAFLYGFGIALNGLPLPSLEEIHKIAKQFSDDFSIDLNHEIPPPKYNLQVSEGQQS